MNLKLKTYKKFSLQLSTTSIFYILWTIYSVCYTLSSSEFSYKINLRILNRFVPYISIAGLFFGLFLLKKFKLKKALTLSLFALLVILMELMEKNMTFLIYAMFIMVAQRIDLYQFIHYDFKLKIISCTFVVSMCLLGVINNYKPFINGSQKMAFGFLHPNTFCFYVFVILMEWMIIRFKRMKAIDWIAIIIIFIIIYLLGASRTSCYVFLLIYPLMLIGKYCPKILTPFRLLISFSNTLMASLSFICVYYYSKGNRHMIELNKILTGRLSLASEFLKNSKPGLFGQQIKMVSTREAMATGQKSMILDNAYIRCALIYGLIFLCFFCLINAYLSLLFFRRKQPELSLFILFFALTGFAESHTINLFYNVLMFFILNNSFRIPINHMTLQELHEKLIFKLKRKRE